MFLPTAVKQGVLFDFPKSDIFWNYKSTDLCFLSLYSLGLQHVHVLQVQFVNSNAKVFQLCAELGCGLEMSLPRGTYGHTADCNVLEVGSAERQTQTSPLPPTGLKAVSWPLAGHVLHGPAEVHLQGE